MWTRILLFVLAAGWVPFGLYCFLFPEALTDISGIQATQAAAVTELRAMYGGVQIAVGLSALLGGLRLLALDKALLVQIVALGGLGVARLGGALITGDASAYTLGALGFEWVTLALCVAAMRTVRR